MQNIAIIGAGWLGLPLAKQLSDSGYDVYATRTTADRLQAVEAEGVSGFILQLDASFDASDKWLPSQSKISEELIKRQITTVIGSFPPGFRQGKGDGYANQWKQLIDFCVHAKVKKVVMVSSTTVYPDQDRLMVEADASLATSLAEGGFSEKATIMLRAEQSVIDSGIEYAIVRCAGLFGPERHPARFVSKLVSVSNVALANMVHQLDAVRAIQFSLEHIHSDVVNVTCPNSVSKYDFYREAIRFYHQPLQLPAINGETAKSISADKLLQLGFRFIYPEVTEGLKHL